MAEPPTFLADELVLVAATIAGQARRMWALNPRLVAALPVNPDKLPGPQEMQALVLIETAAATNAQQIADWMALSPSRAEAIITRLRRVGLVDPRGQPIQQDRRRRELVVTDRGAAATEVLLEYLRPKVTELYLRDIYDQGLRPRVGWPPSLGE